MVYTGNGKGKTTAALGLALRAAGHGKRAYIIQFMKGDEDYGEVKAVRRYLPNITLVQSGLPSFVDRGSPSEEDIRLAKEGLALARKVLAEGDWELVILDEVNVAIDYGLLESQEVLNAVLGRAEGVDVVLTGRYAPKELIDAADMVSEVREIKHHYRSGVKAKAGVEY